ncbi:hypothetical protein [Streptomyces olivochromogenes]|uniref:hypothetical protein n=1 Tax=Streptomyces olivochromogenes TaxID=1963 RepID=UPI001F3C2751|nr:hypothetical protein [Streptomyces olivochromogenes]MCF3130776.1 hypothetical protein [Streptomyces olivochromogenes]
MSSEAFADAPDDATIARIIDQLGGDRVRRVPDTVNRSLTLAETEMLRNLDVEFRGNGLPDEPHSRPVRDGAVTHMENACSPLHRA